nr:hypothetical protein [Tanacetum cinerariifolium]
MDEEDSIALKRLSESQEDKASKKQKVNKQVEELIIHLHIVPNNEDDVYTEATPLALKVLVVDYAIYTKNNKPYYKIKRADGSHQLYLSFLSMLRNLDREDLEVLWRLVKERFASTKPKNFFDDFLLTTLGAMFEKPDVQAQIWKNQRSVYGQARVKIKLRLLIDAAEIKCCCCNEALAIPGQTTTGGCIQTGGKIAELDADEDVNLVDVDTIVEMDADTQGRMEEDVTAVKEINA